MNEEVTVTNSALDLPRELLATKESRFASFVYRNKEGELSRYLVHLNVNYKKILQRDLKVLLAINPSEGVEAEAHAELVASIRETLETGKNSNYTKAEYYTTLVPGKPVKYHENEMYINCFVVSKTVIEPGVYKPVKHAPKTLVKNALRHLLKRDKFREFKLDLTQIHAARLNGKVLIID